LYLVDLKSQDEPGSNSLGFTGLDLISRIQQAWPCSQDSLGLTSFLRCIKLYLVPKMHQSWPCFQDALHWTGLHSQDSPGLILKMHGAQPCSQDVVGSTSFPGCTGLDLDSPGCIVLDLGFQDACGSSSFPGCTNLNHITRMYLVWLPS
jgi:hypothetical protein